MVAPAPARPHARLPARLLRALARHRGRKRRLLALPAVRAAGLGLLRDRVCRRRRGAFSRTPISSARCGSRASSCRSRSSATNLVSFAVMLAVVIVLSLWQLPEARDTVWLAHPPRGALRLHRRRLRARCRVPERPLPRRRAPAAGAAPAVVLPHADPVQPQRPPRDRRVPGCGLLPPLGQLPDAADRGDARGDLLGGDCPAPPTRSTRWSRLRPRSRSER